MTEGGQWQQGQWQQPGQGAQPGYGQPQPANQPWNQPTNQPWHQPTAQPQQWPGQYGQPAYAPPAYGPGWPQVPQTWPHGPGRPGLATASAVLGIVTGSLTIIGGLGFTVAGLTGDGDLSTWLLALGLPIGIALLVGGIGLLNRRQAPLVLWSAVAAAVVVVLALLGGIATLSEDDVEGVLGFTVFALPLPIVTACLSGQRTVRDWVTAGAFRG